MEIVELSEPCVSSTDGLAGAAIEPDEQVWRRALSPANVLAMGMGTDVLNLETREPILPSMDESAEVAPGGQVLGEEAAELDKRGPELGGESPGIG